MEATVYWSPGMSLEVLEELVIRKAFKHYQGNKTATASSLGIAIRTLDAKLQKFEMDEIDKEAQHAARRTDRDTQLARSRGIVPNHNQFAVTHFAPKAEAGVRPQPIANAPAQSGVSMPERQEVQEVLPNKAASGNTRKSR